ncbi:MAG: diaminopimelate decarboxylase [Clostridiaceae bacterium]|nr:diaminopimelate decarboxylase [Clostridiaceae bacterium]
MNTPYFLIHEDDLVQNINTFKSALSRFWDNYRIAYSVKTNSLPWLLGFLRERNIMAEVVSDEEYSMALIAGYSDNEIVFNGPIKGKEKFVRAIENGAVVNIDSKKELEWLTEGIVPRNSRVGLRVNIDISDKCSSEIDYSDEGFRFGFSYENGELEKTIHLLENKTKIKVNGLHVHCNSRTRSLDVYRAIAEKVTEIIDNYRLDLEYIDIGGGFFGGVLGKPSAMDYIPVIADVLKRVVSPHDTMLIVEPGSSIISSPVDFVTRVIDVKDTKLSRIVTTDGSRINIDPLWSKNKYFYQLRTKSSQKSAKQIICGYTCMDHDRIMRIYDEPELKIDDEIIYRKVGAYSMTFGGMFIRYYPDVYVKHGNIYTKVRSRIDTEEYVRIHSD